MELQLNLNFNQFNPTHFDLTQQSELIDSLTRFPIVDTSEFVNGKDVAKYTKFASKQLAGNVFKQISLSEFVYGADWDSFPMKVGAKTYHFVTTDLDKHDLFSNRSVEFDIVEVNGVGVLRVHRKDRGYFGIHYLDLSSLNDVLDRVDEEHTVTANYAHKYCCLDPFNSHSFDELLTIGNSTNYRVKYIGSRYLTDEQNSQTEGLILTDKAIAVLEGYLLTGMPYTIELVNRDSDPESVYLFMRYQTIIGGCYIGFIDPSTVPDGIFVDSKVDSESKSSSSNSPAKKLTTYESELSLLHVTESRIELPKVQLENYQKIRGQLTKAGGKYNRNGFDFSEGNAQEIFDIVLAGKRVKSKKQEYSFFATGRTTAQSVIDRVDIQPGMRVLEPHAGHGHIADLVREQKTVMPIVNELWDTNAQVLRDKGYQPYTFDFLEMSPEDICGKVDVIVGNPPWGALVDIDHFMHCLTFLKNGGEICMLLSSTALMLTTSKAKEFQHFLEIHNAYIEDVPAGSFEDTKVNGKLIHISNYNS